MTQPNTVEEILNEAMNVAYFAERSEETDEAHDKAKAQIQRLLLSERIDELLGADDEVRLHNEIDGSYQAWFEARLATLQQEMEQL